MHCTVVEMARVELASKQGSQMFSTRLVFFVFSLINQVENNRIYYLSFKLRLRLKELRKLSSNL